MKALGPVLALLVLVAGCGSDAAAVLEKAATADGSMSIPELVRRIAPAVVHISTEDVTADQFGRAVPTGGVGTGFVIDAEGHVVTNAHVVAGAASIRVTLTDGRGTEAELVGADGLTDLAVLKIDLDGLTIAPLGPSMELEVGETVVAMGHALDLPGGPTVTVGVVSALDRTLTDVGPGGATLSDLIQTDASINPGNSGGPLLDTAGRVVGISSAGIVGSDNLGFAISIDGAREIIAELIASGGIERGFLGIVSATITPGIARRFELPVSAGVYVDRVTAGSAAEAAGLRPSDIIVGLAGERVDDQGDLGRLLARNKPGSEVEVNYVRGEDAGERTATVVLGARPAEE
jgi:serine protease Do